MMKANREICLTAVRAADGGARLLLSFRLTSELGDEETQLSLFSARLPRLPHPGPVSEDDYQYYRQEALLCEAMGRGLRLLSFGGCSRRTLVQKLCRRGVSPELSRLAAEELCAGGYLSESENALREAERGLDKLWGDRRILADLAAKGYGEEVFPAVRERLSREPGETRCVRLLRKKRFPLPRTREEAEKLFQKLSRYGYGRREIGQALADLEN